ncbi:Na+/H+ antiporter NhaC [Rossellomorea marisflavi]|uniref:Na+/H+ antiporter NhaC n=1 Tax=Rossellomorea marisflavi TaxID=189381 RepID=UPI00345A574C
MNKHISNTPKVWEAALILIIVLSMIGTFLIKLETVPHIPIAVALILLIIYGLARKVTFKSIEEGMLSGIQGGLGAILLFIFIGMLVGSWLTSGTIQTIMYGGFSFLTPAYFYAIAFLITALCGVIVGSSLTTAATIGVAIIGISETMGLSMGITAGAIVSGAFFGDKMSPLSDTTNLASSVVKVDLFEHIRNMAWTTIPAFIISLILFAVLSPNGKSAGLGDLDALKQALGETGVIHWYSLIPLLLLVVMVMMKVPALLTLAINIVVSTCLAFIHGMLGGRAILNALFSGYVSKSGNEALDALLTRGGIDSMMFTIGLVILSLSLGGLLFKLGIIPVLLEKVSSILQSASRTIFTTALTAIGLNFAIGEQYLSILLTGEAFQEQYKKIGLHPKNLSRTLEDAGTVINALVPWGVSGIFIAEVLGVPTLTYLPFAFFCLLSPILTILFGFTGWTITKTDGKTAER